MEATTVEQHSRRLAASPRTFLVLVGFVAVCQLAGALGAGATDSELYATIERPPLAPPGWVFAPVWITLYTLMGIAGWLVWSAPRAGARSRALAWFAVQLVLNAAWTPVFFGIPSFGGGLVIIGALLAAIVATMIAMARVTRLASWLLAPYLAWVGFATYLNAAIWWLNR